MAEGEEQRDKKSEKEEMFAMVRMGGMARDTTHYQLRSMLPLLLNFLKASFHLHTVFTNLGILVLFNNGRQKVMVMDRL